jgi:hypothetical protein
LIASLLSPFVEKKYFHGNMGTNKCPRVLQLGEIPQNTHRNKKGVVLRGSLA